VAREHHHLSEVGLRIEAVVGSDQIENIAAITGSPIGPQPSLFAFKNDLKAIARASQHIAHEEVATPSFPRSKHPHQDRLKPSD
jgi:hypothetical protein